MFPQSACHQTNGIHQSVLSSKPEKTSEKHEVMFACCQKQMDWSNSLLGLNKMKMNQAGSLTCTDSKKITLQCSAALIDIHWFRSGFVYTMKLRFKSCRDQSPTSSRLVIGARAVFFSHGPQVVSLILEESSRLNW